MIVITSSILTSPTISKSTAPNHTTALVNRGSRMSSSSPEDEVVLQAESLAERQSRSRLPSMASISPDNHFIPLPTTSAIRLPSTKKNRGKDKSQDQDSGPKVDTEGLHELLRATQDVQHHQELNKEDRQSASQSQHQHQESSQESGIDQLDSVQPASIQLSSEQEAAIESNTDQPTPRSRASLSINASSSRVNDEVERRKRMTVLMDGEMPEEDSEEEQGGEQQEASSQDEDGLLEDDRASEDEQQNQNQNQNQDKVESQDHLEIQQDPSKQVEASESDHPESRQQPISAHSKENSSESSRSLHHHTSKPSEIPKSRSSSSQITSEVLPNAIVEVSTEDDPSALETGSEDGNESEAAESDEVETEEESEEDDDEEEEEAEPSLKYQRMKGGATDIFAKDTASSLAMSERFLALGTHAGMIFILDVEGNLVKGFRSHSASILNLEIDSSSEFVASAGMDGLVSISALSTSEQYVFDFKRPMRCVALEPNFGRRSTRALVCGGMAGNLIHREKSWFGHKETILHSGEGPIWTVEWRGSLIAWANDRGVRIYDTQSKQRITFISPPSVNPRADLFRCSLFWQDDRTLLIGWADHIKIAKIKERKPSNPPSVASVPTLNSSTSLYVEITAIFELDCMISGLVPYGKDYLVLAYLTDDNFDEAAQDHRRRKGFPPELRIISNSGDELSSDVLSLQNFERYQCNDYLLVPSAEAIANGRVMKEGKAKQYDSDSNVFYVVSPKDIVMARPRDEKDHVDWLLERKKYEEALVKVEAMGSELASLRGYNSAEIGRKYLSWLVDEENLEKAAKVASKILGRNAQAWEDWIFLFVERGKLGTVIPYVPISDPVLTGMVYDMILAHFLQNDPKTLLTTLKNWPPEIYSTQAVVIAIEDKLERDKSQTQLLMECLAELYIANRQPGKALPYFLRLRRPGVFDLIREHNLFTAVQDQALLLIEFEQDLSSKQKEEQRVNTVRKSIMGGEIRGSKHGAAIDLLVDHTHSILIHRVISQLEGHPRYLYMYLDALFDRDPQLASDFSDLQVKLYAEFDSSRLMPYLRAMSSFYSFDKAYLVCKEHDYVPEMVFLLGRVGDNKRALNLIIERLGDVERAIDFAKEQNDDDLWEDLLKYSETKPAFIRGLLENVGAEIDPLRLIRRIKDGLEISGLKPALIKILHDYNLQISLLEGCAAVLYHDSRGLSVSLHQSQTNALYCDNKSMCTSCGDSLLAKPADSFTSVRRSPHRVLFLCKHAYHLSCLIPIENIPQVKGQVALSDPSGSGLPPVLMTATQAGTRGDGIYGPARRSDEAEVEFEKKLRYEGRLKVVLRRGCPSCSRERGMRVEGVVV